MDIFAKRLREERENKKTTQKVVYTFLKMSQNGYSSYEQGRTEPNLENLVKIADYFQVTTDYLLGREDYGTGIIEIKQEPSEIDILLRDLNPTERQSAIKIFNNFLRLNKSHKDKVEGYINALLEEE